jgi:hypothetical protein
MTEATQEVQSDIPQEVQTDIPQEENILTEVAETTKTEAAKCPYFKKYWHKKAWKSWQKYGKVPEKEEVFAHFQQKCSLGPVCNEGKSSCQKQFTPWKAQLEGNS